MIIDDRTPVLVEWWVHTFIPSKHHAVIVDYGTAKKWARHYKFINVQIIDPALGVEMVAKR
jgi:hypothetical protein